MAVARTGFCQLNDMKEEFLNCKVCTLQYTMKERKPKELPCRHTYCTSCIDKIEPKHCPTCREKFNLGEQGAETLQDNLTIKQFMDFLKVGLSVTDEKEGLTTCEECTRGLKSVSWCYHCRRQICEKCEECHKQMRSFSGHKVESLSTVRLSDAMKIFYCDLHKKEQLNKFCERCNEIICDKCKVLVHNQHQDKVVDLKCVHEQNLNEFEKLVSEVMSIQEKAILKSCLASRKTYMLDENYRTCVKEMDLFFTNLKSTINITIDDQRKKLTEIADAFKLASVDQFKKETEEAEIFLSHIGSTLETFQPILDRKCPVEIARTFNNHRESLEKLVSRSKSLPHRDQNSYSLLKFTYCDNLAKSIIENTSIDAFNVVPGNTNVFCDDGIVNLPCRILIRLNNRKNEICIEINEIKFVEVSVCLNCEATQRISCKIKLLKPGEYEACFVPPASGFYDVSLKILGEYVSSPTINVGKFYLRILRDEAQNTVRANAMIIDADGSKMPSDLTDVNVQCLDPTSQYVKESERHVSDSILEAKFILKHTGRHLLRVMFRDHEMECCEEVFVKYQFIGMRGDDTPGWFQNITDLTVLPSGNILVLDLMKSREREVCKLTIWNSVGECIETNITTIESSHRPCLTVGGTNQLKGCICSFNEKSTLLTFFAHTPALKLNEEVRLVGMKKIKPRSIAMNSKGTVLVSNTQSVIEIIHADGRQETILDYVEIEELDLHAVEDISVDSNDNIFICDSKNKCVLMLNYDYELVKIFRSDSDSSNPIAIAIFEKTLLTLEKRKIVVTEIDDEKRVTAIDLPFKLLQDDRIAYTTGSCIITNLSKSCLVKCMHPNTSV